MKKIIFFSFLASFILSSIAGFASRVVMEGADTQSLDASGVRAGLSSSMELKPSMEIEKMISEEKDNIQASLKSDKAEREVLVLVRGRIVKDLKGYLEREFGPLRAYERKE